MKSARNTATQLKELRSELESLAGRRRRARAVDVLLIGGGVAAIALLVVYLLDRRLTLNVASRGFLDLLLLAALTWFVLKRLLPTLVHRDDAIETALRFERRRGIDADLVAALEFDAVSQDKIEDRYGSRRLTGAVVEQANRARRDWNFSEEPIDAASTSRRAAWAAVIAFFVGSALVYPRHAAVFAERLLLGSAHYPSNTQIEKLTVNGRPVTFILPTTETSLFVVPLGRPIAFELQLSGTRPETALIELTGEHGGLARLELTPVDAARDRFQGTLPALVESVTGRVVAGDAYSDSFALHASALPTVTVTLEVTPPEYAAGAALDTPSPGRLHAAVLEGSDVAIRVESAAKTLAEVVLTHGDAKFPLQRAADERSWRLDPRGTEFAAVKLPIEFQLDVVDTDGFHLVEPLRGSIALRPDQPPTVAADVITKYVLPEGRPSILYQAADDLGVQSLVIERLVQRADGTTASDAVPVPLPTEGPRTSLAGKFALSLAGLQLHKGDRVTIYLTARDRKGDDARASARSEPFVLEVTDEQGLYEAMAETDQRSALKMDEIIQKQLLMTGRPASSPAPKPTATASPTGTPSASPTATGVKP
jgi:hypothetical protein